MKKLAAFLALIILVMSVCTVGIGETETPENRGNLLCKNTVAANTLPPQKAAILLRLALTGETSQEQLEVLFEQY